MHLHGHISLDQLQTALGGYNALTIATDAVTPDLTAGANHEVVLNQATQITINDPVLSYPGGVIHYGAPLMLIVVQDATGGRPTPAWGSGYAGVSGFEIGRDANCRNSFEFIWTGTVWALRGTPLIGNL